MQAEIAEWRAELGKWRAEMSSWHDQWAAWVMAALTDNTAHAQAETQAGLSHSVASAESLGLTQEELDKLFPFPHTHEQLRESERYSSDHDVGTKRHKQRKDEL